MATSPIIRRRRLAGELRQLREDAGLTAQTLASKSGMSRSKVSRLETAEQVPTVPDVTAVLTALGVDGDRRDALVQMAQDAAQHGWWADYGRDMGARQQTYADLEFGAQTIREYPGWLVPGLVQTAAYTRARAELTARLSDKQINVDRAVEAKQMRHRMLMRRDGPTRYEVIIEEAAVRRPAAPDDVMREQLAYLATLAAPAARRGVDARIVVRILPIEARIDHFWLPRSAFTLYDYAGGDPRAAAVDAETADLIYTAPGEVAPYEQLYSGVQSAALSPKDSAAWLRDQTQ